jgi:hydrogenase expression/formation protein HypC
MCLAVPGKVVEITEAQDAAVRRGKVEFAGVRREVCLSFVPEATVGDYVLVHAGFALSIVVEEVGEPAEAP